MGRAIGGISCLSTVKEVEGSLLRSERRRGGEGTGVGILKSIYCIIISTIFVVERYFINKLKPGTDIHGIHWKKSII